MENEDNNNEKGKPKRLSKTQTHAQRILRMIHCPNLDMGGMFSLVTGAPGSAKTSVMLSFCDYTMKHHPKQKVFFSNGYGTPFQFTKLGSHSYDILVKKDSGVTFHDRTAHRKEIFPKVTYFDSYEDCYELAKPGRCSAVFFGDRYKQMDFLHYLLSVGEWTQVFVDEISEISPAFTAGNTFKKIGQFALDLKECRKTLIGYHCNTQSIRALDHRVIAVLMCRIYLPGAVSGKYSRVTQRAIDNLEVNRILGNEGYVEAYGNFGRTRFKNIYSPDGNRLWETRINEKRR